MVVVTACRQRGTLIITPPARQTQSSSSRFTSTPYTTATSWPVVATDHPRLEHPRHKKHPRGDWRKPQPPRPWSSASLCRHPTGCTAQTPTPHPRPLSADTMPHSRGQFTLPAQSAPVPPPEGLRVKFVLMGWDPLIPSVRSVRCRTTAVCHPRPRHDCDTTASRIAERYPEATERHLPYSMTQCLLTPESQLRHYCV